MLLSKARLIEFVEPVPMVAEDLNLESVWEVFGTSKSDRLVVVDGQKRPLGTMYLSDFLLSDFFAKLSQKATRSPAEILASLPGSDRLTAKCWIAEPLQTLPSELEISEFLEQHISSQKRLKKNANWALVNEKSEYLGLVDTSSLLHYLAQQQGTSDRPQPEKPTPTPANETNLNFLIRLVEQFPLPITLQTNKGKSIAQNQNWQTQIGHTPALSQIPQIDNINFFNQGELLSKNEMLEPCQLEDPKQPCWQFIKIPLPQNILTADSSDKKKPSGADKLLWLVVAIDISHQQQIAAELAAKNADLFQLNRLKDEFLACVSHELKTPLTTVLGLSTMLNEGKVGELNERQSRYMGLIDKSGRQLMTVVNEILDLTRLETSQIQLELAPFPIVSVCDRAYRQALQLYLGKQPPGNSGEPEIGFSLTIDPELGDIVADQERLSQMLAHLLSNAFKFTKAGGNIGLKVSHRQGWISFTVWDTGIGIPEEKQHLLFQKFQQLESPLTREFEGIGLGLVLTQRLARLHGGDLSFISEPGKGSQFTLLLPPVPPRDWRFSVVEEGVEDKAKLWETGELAHQLKSLTPHRAISSQLVLVVETVPRYIEDLTEKLSSLGYWVAIARSGTEALEKARQFQPAAILLNPLLPVLSGWDVLTLLKADNRTRHIPIAITTTLAEKETAWQSKADDFLTLPVEASWLQQSLLRLTKSTKNENQSLAILHLTAPYRWEAMVSQEEELFSSASEPLHTLVSQLNYRVLEADDLEQADFLARVWQPDAIVFDAVGIEEPVDYLQQLSHSQHLGKLPIVTLGERATQAGQQIKTLSVFPCLSAASDRSMRTTSNLLQVIQVAAGVLWEHSLLVLDVEAISHPVASKLSNGDRAVHSDWLLAATQYLHKAGLKSVFSHSWAEVKAQIAAHHFDLLLIYWQSAPSDRQAKEELLALARMSDRPPIIFLDRTDLQDTQNPLSAIFSVCDRKGDGAIRGDNYTMAELARQIEGAIGSQG
jgi:signal transduction histidine kinase/CheY-like chemotaxis protein